MKLKLKNFDLIDTASAIEKTSQKVLNPLEIYTKRALSKGASPEELKAIKQFNLHTESGRKEAAKHLVDKFGLEEGENLQDTLKGYEQQLFEMSKEGDGFGAGMGWNDLGMIHIDPSQISEKDLLWVIAHEKEHAMHVPEEAIKKGVLDENRLTGPVKEYFLGNNNTEVGARIGQVLNNAGITDSRKITGSQLKLWFENYLHSDNLNNEMYSLYKSIKDWDGLAAWANNPRNVYMLPAIGVGGAAIAAAMNGSEEKSLNKFQEGGVILEEPEQEEIPFYEQIAEIPIFRHLPNNLIANDFDNDLSDLLDRKEINYGQLSEDAEIELQKKYNLSSKELNETLDDLFNAGMGKSLVADLFKATSNLQALKQGGVIQKCSIGSAIRKFVGEGLENLGERAAKELGEEITLQATGSVKVIGKATTEHLQKVAKATGDQRIKVLADFAEQCRNKGIRLPEEFNQYVDAIFKTPTAVKKDTKITRVGKEITAKPELVEYKGKTVERPTFEKTKYKTKTIHTGEFRNALEFKRTIPKTQEELQLISPKIDEAINSLRSMMEGDQFKLTPMMMDEVYFKSKGRVQNFADTKEQSRLIRKLFGEIEYPNIVKRQLDNSYIHPQAPSQELSKFYNASADNIEWFKGIKNFTQFHTLYHLNLPGEVQVTPLKIKPKAKQLAVYHKTGNFVSFLPKQIMTKQDTPYVKAYKLTLNGKPIKGVPAFKFEEHHSTPLALMQAEAYLTNPLPKNTMEHVRTYQNQRKVNGSKNSHYDNFLVLNKAEHTGINGIHYNDKYSLQDLQRIKAISRSGRFKTMEDLLNYYDQLKTQQLAYLPKAKSGIKLIPKNSFGSKLMRELVPKVSKITGKSEKDLIKLIASGKLSENELMNLAKQITKNSEGILLKPTNSKYAEAFLTTPGSSPTTFNGEILETIRSPKGGKVTNKFYTGQGSEYIITEDGYARRIKSDQGKGDHGLHDWNKGYTAFLDPSVGFDKIKMETIRSKFPHAVPTMTDKGLVFISPKNGKWEVLKTEELFPASVKQGTLPKGDYIIKAEKTPTLGYTVLEYNRDPQNFWFHPGHEVSFIESSI